MELSFEIDNPSENYKIANTLKLLGDVVGRTYIRFCLDYCSEEIAQSIYKNVHPIIENKSTITTSPISTRVRILAKEGITPENFLTYFVDKYGTKKQELPDS